MWTYLHDYLGMNVYFATPSEVTFDMIPYLSKVLDDVPERIMVVSSTPAAAHLFKIRNPKKARLLPKLQAVVFHHITVQLLFLSYTHRDIQTTVGFLTTRVKSPDEDDWGKLKWVLKYLCVTSGERVATSEKRWNVNNWIIVSLE
jgi:hypothetical protein